MRGFRLIRRRRALVALVSLFILAAAAAAVAQPPTQAPGGGDRVVARVGERTITVAELERRMRQVPPFQLRVLGSTPDEIRRAYLDLLIEQELLARGARAEKLDQRRDVLGRQRAVLRSAMLAELRLEAGDGRDVSKEDVKAYYDNHKSRYRSEKLLKLWQIVVRSRKDAEAVLAVIRTDPEYAKDPVKGWAALVQKHSVDELSKTLNGNLEFVRPDGTTKRPGLKVSPALYQAADGVADGEVVPEPVRDGARFVIVQRRGTRETPERSLESEAPAIRRKLAQQLYEESVEKIKKELRRKYRPDVHPERVDVLEVTSPGGEIVTARRPGGLPRSPHGAAGSPRPQGAPGRLR